MLKVLFAILTAAVFTIFAMDNMHRVELGLIVGKPMHVRLFFLLLSAFLVGCFSAAITSLYLRARSKKQKQAAQEAQGDSFFEGPLREK